MANGNIKDIISDPEIEEFEMGQWYGFMCGKKLREFANRTNTPVFIVRGGQACQKTKKFYDTVLNNQQNFGKVAQTKAVFLYYTGAGLKSHIEKTQNDTNGKVSTGYYDLCQDFMAFSEYQYDKYIYYHTCNKEPFPMITGYHNMGNGTIKMAVGDIKDADLSLITKNIRTKTQMDSITDIQYYIDWFNAEFEAKTKTYEFNVDFYDYDEKTRLCDTQVVKMNDNAVPPTSPTREGYNFIGWNPSYKNIQNDTNCIATYSKIDGSNLITKNRCFGLNGNCTITTGDGVKFAYDNENCKFALYTE